jgi:hypothetical protein
MKKMSIVASGSTVIEATAIINPGEEKTVKADDVAIMDDRDHSKIKAICRKAVGSNENLRATGFSLGQPLPRRFYPESSIEIVGNVLRMLVST